MIKLKGLIKEENRPAADRANWMSGNDGDDFKRSQYLKHTKAIGDELNRMLQSTDALDESPIKYSGMQEDIYYPHQGDVGFNGPQVSYETIWDRKVPIELNGQKVEEYQYFEIYTYSPDTGTTNLEIHGQRSSGKVPGMLNKFKRAFAYISGKSTMFKYGGKGSYNANNTAPGRPAYARKHADGSSMYKLKATIDPGHGDMFSKSPKQIAEEIYPYALATFAPIDVARASNKDFAEFIDNPEGWESNTDDAYRAMRDKQ